MKHMSGAIMTLIFLGVPLLFVLALLVRGALRTLQQWRFDRGERPRVRRPGPPRLE
jgi:hypothetical protein